MKHLIIFSTLVILVCSCRKDQAVLVDQRFAGIKGQLQDSVSQQIFSRLDFSAMVISENDGNPYPIAKIPLISTINGIAFVLIQMDQFNRFSFGRIVQINFMKDSKAITKQTDLNGEIKILSLDEKLFSSSSIVNGYVTRYYASPSKKVAVVPVPKYQDLPEVIITTSILPKETTQSYVIWLQLNSLLNNTSLSGTGAYYANSSSGGAGAAGGGTSVGTSPNEIYVDFETSDNEPIDIKAYLKCFSAVPDAGAVYNVTIYSDIPVDTDPTIGFDLNSGSPGHTFLLLRKENGTQSVQQIFGFYPMEGWKVGLTTAPVTGKFVDNGGHEFNASYNVSISADEFKSKLIHIEYLSNFIKYDLDEYNCTDLALDIFNYQRGSGLLVIPKLTFSGGNSVSGSSTPQGLFMKLKEIKAAGGSAARPITIPGVKGFAGAGHGPCK